MVQYHLKGKKLDLLSTRGKLYIVTQNYAEVVELNMNSHVQIFHHQILFGGTSAGGVGVLANADHLQELVHPAEVIFENFIEFEISV